MDQNLAGERSQLSLLPSPEAPGDPPGRTLHRGLPAAECRRLPEPSGPDLAGHPGADGHLALPYTYPNPARAENGRAVTEPGLAFEAVFLEKRRAQGGQRRGGKGRPR